MKGCTSVPATTLLIIHRDKLLFEFKKLLATELTFNTIGNKLKALLQES